MFLRFDGRSTALQAKVAFESVEKARVFANLFERNAPIWSKMSDVACNQLTPTRILDVGCGPGEPTCHFAQKFKVPTIASDIAAPMIELAKERARRKGLTNVEFAVFDMVEPPRQRW